MRLFVCGCGYVGLKGWDFEACVNSCFNANVETKSDVRQDENAPNAVFFIIGYDLRPNAHEFPIQIAILY